MHQISHRVMVACGQVEPPETLKYTLFISNLTTVDTLMRPLGNTNTKFLSKTQLIIHQMQDVSTQGTLSTAYRVSLTSWEI